METFATWTCFLTQMICDMQLGAWNHSSNFNAYQNQNTKIHETKVLTGEAASAMALSKNALLGIVHKAPIYRLSFSFRKLRILLAQALITCGVALLLLLQP